MVFYDDFLDDKMPVKDRKRAFRRKNDIYKALRKRRISNDIYRLDWYNNLHEYSKNKVHCSCNLCRFNGKTCSDMKKELSIDYKLKEYNKVS